MVWGQGPTLLVPRARQRRSEGPTRPGSRCFPRILRAHLPARALARGPEQSQLPCHSKGQTWLPVPGLGLALTSPSVHPQVWPRGVRTKGKESGKPTCSSSAFAQGHGPGAPGGQLDPGAAPEQTQDGRARLEAGSPEAAATASVLCAACAAAVSACVDPWTPPARVSAGVEAHERTPSAGLMACASACAGSALLGAFGGNERIGVMWP